MVSLHYLFTHTLTLPLKGEETFETVMMDPSYLGSGLTPSETGINAFSLICRLDSRWLPEVP